MIREECRPLVVITSLPPASIDPIELGDPGEDTLPMLEQEREHDQEQPIPDTHDDDGDGADAVLQLVASSSWRLTRVDALDTEVVIATWQHLLTRSGGWNLVGIAMGVFGKEGV